MKGNDFSSCELSLWNKKHIDGKGKENGFGKLYLRIPKNKGNLLVQLVSWAEGFFPLYSCLSDTAK